MKNIIIIESIDSTQEVNEYGLGFGDSNPNEENYFECESLQQAQKLYNLIEKWTNDN